MKIPYVEKNCTITFEGKNFESDGAITTDNYLIAYPGKHGRLNNWHGKKIGIYFIISSRRAPNSFINNRYYYMRARIGGNEYSLQGYGEGFIAKGKRLKNK